MRNDVHSPKNLVTEDYLYVGSFDTEPVYGRGPEANAWAAEMRAVYASTCDRAPHGGNISQCDHCGAALRYVAILRHTTGQYVSVGETCLANRFELATADFHRLRKAAQLDRERAAARAAAAAFISATTHTAEGEPVDWPALNASTNEFVQDVLRKLAHWGDISPRQLTAIVRAVARDAARAETPAEVWANVPTIKRATVTGEVLTVKGQDTQYGWSLKMLVKVTDLPGTDGPVKLWGTAPAIISSVVTRGDVVTFTASVKASDRDATFGIFSRPTNASRREAEGSR
jgi:hypothetical protein